MLGPNGKEPRQFFDRKSIYTELVRSATSRLRYFNRQKIFLNRKTYSMNVVESVEDNINIVGFSVIRQTKKIKDGVETWGILENKRHISMNVNYMTIIINPYSDGAVEIVFRFSDEGVGHSYQITGSKTGDIILAFAEENGRKSFDV